MDIVREKVIRVADLQWVCLSRRQLRGLGVSEARIARWVRDGYLRKVLPHVYALGHIAASAEADLVAAILYAGPGAMLSHATAPWWHGLLAQQPSTIQISTPRKCRSLPGIMVYARRKLELEHRRRLPTTPVSQALLDFAASASVERVVRALAQADFQRVLDVAPLRAFSGNGRPGSRTLKQAIRRHTPPCRHQERTRKRLSRALPPRQHPPHEVNLRVCGLEVDAI